jgi:hypothetical protein
MRTFTLSVVALGVAIAACTGGGGGDVTGGEASGGSGGSARGSGGLAMTGAGGKAMGGHAGANTGGTEWDAGGGSEATGGALPLDANEDAPGEGDGPAATITDAAGGDATVVLTDPKTWPGGAFSKPFIIECPAGAPREACCLHYCTCMMTNCARQTPADCMAACIAPTAVAKWDLRCRVYNCFESLNPLATKDHQAHCEHAGVYTGTQRTRGAGDTEGKCHMAGEPNEP